MIDGRGSADAHQSAYRPDIDGLRAVAVLSVIAFHLSGNWLPGGYLGVDIFFVISGYLITNVIWREALSGNFSIARFYERRIRRIAPALCVVLLAVSAVSAALLLPVDLVGYTKSLFASLGFVANIYFWRDTNYFARTAEFKPLLHLWSLGVEEQFYIFFPLLVLLCTRLRRGLLLPTVVILSLFSLAADATLIRVGGSAPAFYLIPTRAWELGAGSLLTLLPASRPLSAALRHLLATAAAGLLLLALLYPAFTLHEHVPEALWAVLGSSLVLFLGSVGGNWLSRALSSSLPVGIGLISYSLYLWHWPILVFLRYYLVAEPGAPALAAAVALMFLLAYLSWRFVERHFRNRTMPVRQVLVWTCSGSLAVALFAAVLLANHGFPVRLNAETSRINSAVDTNYRCGVSDMLPFGGSHACVLNLPSRRAADASLVLLGNSHAQMYAPLVADALRAHQINGLLVPVNSCLPTPDFNESIRCMGIARSNLDSILALPNLRTVVLAMTWRFVPIMLTPSGSVPASSQPAAFLAALDSLIATLRSHGIHVVIIGPLAEPKWDVASDLSRALAFHRPVTQPLFTPLSDFLAENGAYISHISAQADVTFIRPDLVECQSARCDFLRDGRSIFSDNNHVAAGSLYLFAPEFNTGLEQAFTREQQSPAR